MNKEKRLRYNKNWETVSQRIRLERANNCCELCKLQHGNIIKRLQGENYRQATAEELTAVKEFKKLYRTNHFKTLKHFGLIQIVITVGHLNHIETDDRDINLLAMCQRCHLMFDRGNNWIRQQQKKLSSESELNFD